MEQLESLGTVAWYLPIASFIINLSKAEQSCSQFTGNSPVFCLDFDPFSLDFVFTYFLISLHFSPHFHCLFPKSLQQTLFHSLYLCSSPLLHPQMPMFHCLSSFISSVCFLCMSCSIDKPQHAVLKQPGFRQHLLWWKKSLCLDLLWHLWPMRLNIQDTACCKKAHISVASAWIKVQYKKPLKKVRLQSKAKQVKITPSPSPGTPTLTMDKESMGSTAFKST